MSGSPTICRQQPWRAREHVGWMVSRDTSALTKRALPRPPSNRCSRTATTPSSVRCSGSSCSAAPAPCSSGWPTRSTRCGATATNVLHFAAAARLDDVLNYFPGAPHCTDLRALRQDVAGAACWRKQAPVGTARMPGR